MQTREDSEQRQRVVLAFRETLDADLAKGDEFPLQHYVELFPGHLDVIAREYIAAENARQSHPLDSSESDADHLGPYALEHELGRGGQGAVFLAEDTRLGRKVALKVLSGLGPGAKEHIKRFRREAELAGRLDHPGICGVHEAGIEGGVPFIAMRYIDGETLAQRIAHSKGSDELDGPETSFVDFSVVGGGGADDAGGEPVAGDPLSSTMDKSQLDATLALFEKTALALHAAHELGIVHRDIKPGNIIVTKDGEPVLLDFGLARADDGAGPSLTQSGDLFGTPAYMSPEQVAAQRIGIDRRTDIYSLGVTLFECLTLSRPFEAPTREGLYKAILTQEAPDARKLNPAISPELRIVLACTLEKNSDRRYATAEDFAEDLNRVRELRPIAARPVSRWLRAKRWAQRNPVLATATLGLFIAISSVAGVFYAQNQEVLRESRLKDAALTKERSALSEKNTALAAYDRLADVKKLQEAVAEAEVLWPARPRMVAAIQTWIGRFGVLETNLANHEAALVELRARAAPYSETHRERAHAETRAAIAALDEETKGLEAELNETKSDDRFDEIEERLEGFPAERTSLQARLEERLSWRFEGEDAEALGWKHEVLGELVSDLRIFVSEAGALADVKKRLASAESMRARTVDAYQESWDDALARLRISESYGKLVLKAQVGLIPLGPDPKSGLEEFLHFESHLGPLPERVNGSFEVTGDTGVILVLLSGVTFDMGAQRADATKPNHDPQARPEEGPVHEVTLAPFFLAKYELTRGQWIRTSGKEDPSRWVAETTGGTLQPEAYTRHPVEQVSWEDCDRATYRSGFSLPTEAQWEYGCRGGTSTVWFFGDDTTEMKSHGNVADLAYAKAFGASAGAHEKGWDDSHAVTAPVGSFSANGFGLHDVHGNVWEWCRDWFGSYATDQVLPLTGERRVRGSGDRVNRSGSFFETAMRARSTHRYRNTPELRLYSIGLRVCLQVHH